MSVASSKISVRKILLERGKAAYPGCVSFAYFALHKQRKVGRHRRNPILINEEKFLKQRTKPRPKRKPPNGKTRLLRTPRHLPIRR
ncbi:hypothetical protein CF65_00658 [Aggregatibacter actinomycetemcomitans HK1651]|nr:hypothetical protein CF65_00658 [Aggregatibacter actinomycetemcomitans HK1651]